ncbi:MAG: hypothetical protein AB7G62_09625 [Magnetospirillum sp.]
MRRLMALGVVAFLAGCALPPPDQPASVNRMGRFLGLVSHCGCSDIDADRMLAEYPKAVAHYSTADIKAMKGYVDVGLSENFDNQIEICTEACSQSCMVNAVAQPLGGKTIPGTAACLVNERDLHLTEGRMSGDWD